ncbi:MAG TPA: peptidase M61 [Rheinheimera sp.]|uniref:M61 family metallopeptidase n=1 Tax=Rheinheimera sp. TaxID=1869214 RepID=UPI000EDF3E58|nr:PDZ domain-containing protein [Rheinheimera sp.]HCU66473.1 peptidase M61 [Rheinheimera sp.]
MKVILKSWWVLMLLYGAAVKAQTYYQINISQPEHHLAEVQMKFKVTTPGVVELKLPAWRTGKYQILDLANGVRLFQARDQQGQLLKFRKKEKSSWLLELPAAGDIEVSYQIYANQLGERSRHIDETHAYINPSAYLMFSDELRSQPSTVQLQVPANWRSTSGMPRGDNPHQFKAANYDVLSDSPIETGIHQSFSFVVDNRNYEVVFWGEGNYDSKQIVTDLQKLVAQAPSIWQGYPYQNYLFIIHATSGARGATEHLNSTVIQRDRFSFASRKHYLEFLGTAAHELVHTWNVKAYRPAELVPYDYLAPNYTELLWISEGSTSYFQNQLLLRAGLMTPAEFYEDLAKRLEKFARLPGAKVQSVAQSSFDSWISLSGDHADNFSVNIYSEGYLVSWLLDQHLLRHSGLKANYRTLHNELYQRFGKTTAFTAADVQQIALDLTGKPLTEFWQQQVESPLQLDAAALLADAGLEYKTADKQQAWLGVTGSFNAGVEKLSKVERDGPAWQAGLTSEDEVIAVNRLQLKSALTDRLKDFKPGEKLTLTLFRQGRLLDKTVTLGALPAEPGKIVPVKKPSRQQKLYHQAWLGVPLTDGADSKAKR